MPLSKPPSHLHVLIADDNEDDALLIVHRIRTGGYEVEFECIDGAPDMAAALARRTWDVIISDVNMPRFGAAAALALATERGVDCPFIVVSGVIGEETAVTLLKNGAHDFILKSNLARLVPAIERELRDAEVRHARREAEDACRISEERYALVARGTNDGLWDWDLVAGKIYYSARWKAILGFDAGIIGDDPAEWLDRVHPDDAEDFKTA